MNQTKQGSWLGRLLGSFKQDTRDAGQIGGQAEPVAQHSSAEPGTPPDEELDRLRKAVERSPGDSQAYIELGDALKKRHRLEEALTSYGRVLEREPDSALAHYKLGNVLMDMGRLDEAISRYDRALTLKPDYPEALNNQGNALKGRGRQNEALRNYERALRLKPDLIQAHISMGNVLRELGRLEESVESFGRALQLNANSVLAHHNLGVSLGLLGRLEEAMSSCQRALELDPTFSMAYSNILLTYNLLPMQSPATHFAQARAFGEMESKRSKPYSHWACVPDPEKCLRVGWVSGDFGYHSVGHFIEGVLAALKSSANCRIELIGYSSFNRFGPKAERIKACFHGWRSVVGLSDEQMADLIHKDGIDILIDLSGHTAHNRLPVFAWKPAPIQVTWLGYPGTTGLASMDYLIADKWTLPEVEDAYFTEKVFRLPETYICLTPPSVDVEVGPLPASTNAYLTFGSFNNFSKINEMVMDVWARILESVPESRLYLKNNQPIEGKVKQDMARNFTKRGISPHRLILEGPLPERSQHLAAYNRVDIALDPFPYPGVTTSAESLWMGVPVLTLAGERFISRQGVGLMMNAGLPEWIATDLDDYVARAVRHASDIEKLSALRRGLRQRVLASPIFDAQRFAGHFEAALRGMWVEWCERQKKN